MKFFKKLILTFLGVIILVWIALLVYDFIKCGHENENGKVQKPLIVLNQKTFNYDDGTVTEYMSLGYKYVEYNRTSIKAYEFGPFWMDIREP